MRQASIAKARRRKRAEKLKKARRPDVYQSWLKWRASIVPGLLGDTDDVLVGIDETAPPGFDFSK